MFIASPTLAYVLVNDQSEIVLIQGRVLDSNSESDDEDSESESNESSDNDEQDERDDPDEPDEVDEQKETETESEDGTRTKTKLEDDGEFRAEIVLPDGTKVKTRTEDDRTRTDVYQGDVKIRLERVGDRFRIKTENDLGEEIEIGKDNLISIDERADHNQIQIRAFDSATDQLQNKTIIERLNTQALTDLPLSINLETNELTVTTSAGERTVTVLPDQAVQNMLAANVIDQIGGQELVNLVRQGGIETLDQVIQLSQQNGVPVYEAQGIKQHRLFGFFTVTTDVTVTVSAETGEVLDTNQSFLDNVIDVFSTTV